MLMAQPMLAVTKLQDCWVEIQNKCGYMLLRFLFVTEYLLSIAKHTANTIKL